MMFFCWDGHRKCPMMFLHTSQKRQVFFFKLHSLRGSFNILAESLGRAYPGDFSGLWTLLRGKFQEATYRWQLLLYLQVPQARPWALHSWSSCRLSGMRLGAAAVRPCSEQCLGPETNLDQTLNYLNLPAVPFDSAWSASFCLTTDPTIISLPEATRKRRRCCPAASSPV